MTVSREVTRDSFSCLLRVGANVTHDIRDKIKELRFSSLAFSLPKHNELEGIHYGDKGRRLPQV